MNLLRIFKKQPHRLEHGQASDAPTASDVPAVPTTLKTSSHPVGAEILVPGVDPITAE